MLLRLLLLFTIVPLIELALLLYLTELTSWRVSVGLVLTTGIVGALLAKLQGAMVYRRAGEQMARGETPTDTLLDGMMILVAGCLLITPGILTDVLGFSLLLPPVRTMIRRRVRDRVMAGFSQQMPPGGFTMPGQWASGQSDDFDDKIVDAKVIDEQPPQLETGDRHPVE